MAEIFLLEIVTGSLSHIIINLEKRGASICRPVNKDTDWLDVKVGDEIYIRGKRHRVEKIRPYRAYPILDKGYEWVESGRTWLDAN